MESFALTWQYATYIFARFNKGTVMMKFDHYRRLWQVTTNTGQETFTENRPEVLMQETFDFLSGFYTWETYVEKIQEGRD